MGHTSLPDPSPATPVVLFLLAPQSKLLGDTDTWESCQLWFSENRTPLTAHLVCVYCVDKEVVCGCESHGDNVVPLLPPLSVTFLANLAISDDRVCYSASVFPTRSDTDPVLSGTFSSGRM